MKNFYQNLAEYAQFDAVRVAWLDRTRHPPKAAVFAMILGGAVSTTIKTFAQCFVDRVGGIPPGDMQLSVFLDRPQQQGTHLVN